MISGVRLERADILLPVGTDLAGHLVNRTICAITRRAKRIIVRLDDEGCFYFHLGMTGQLTLDPPAAPRRVHTHLTLDIGRGRELELRFRDPRRFGGIWWLGQSGDANANLGPEPLTLRAVELGRRLAGTKRAVKAALLDQRLIAGLGNIYVDESLFAARIHPLARADRLSDAQIGRLNRAIKQVLRKAIEHRGSTLRDYMDAEGKSGGFQNRHQVYDRAAKPCVACDAPITRIVIGGRSTHFCRRCQKKR